MPNMNTSVFKNERGNPFFSVIRAVTNSDADLKYRYPGSDVVLDCIDY